MALPTSQWGNTGVNLFASIAAGNFSADVYSTAPGPTTTTPGSADGPILGNYQTLADGTFVQFLQASGTIAAYAAVKPTLPWQLAYQVSATGAANDFVIAANDRSFAALSANNCTWFTLRGLAFPLVAASVSTVRVAQTDTTAGTLKAAVAGTNFQSNLYNTVAVGSGGAAASPVYFGF